MLSLDQIVMTQTALLEFYSQLGTAAGFSERRAANEFLLNVDPIVDNPSQRVASLRITRSVGANDKIIFGTADRLGILTITADKRFINAAKEQGVDLSSQVLLHDPYSFIGV